ncbi:CPBP family intramembrane metalloprotease [bacterium]|nr:CPBP family intramembrane metalloprotease [bacterium]
MESVRFNRKDGVTIAVCIALFSVSLWIGVNWFDDAFPEASIDFKTTRASSEPLALEALALIDQVPPQEYRHASRFSYSGLAKTYLEKELGLADAQKYFGNPVELWSWSHRWFKPSTKEEFKADISPEGRIVSIEHKIAEEAEGASLTRDSAYTIASEFLFETIGLDSSTVTLLEGSQTGRPHRTDWEFTWKLNDFEPVEGSDNRYQVTLLGDQIGTFDQFLHVPEAWTADYRRLRSLNQLAGNVDSVFMLLTVVAIVAVFFVRIKRLEIHWRTAIWFGGIAALLMYMNNLNQMPQTLYWYDTTTSWSGFLLNELLLGLLASIGGGVLIAILTASAEAIFRNHYPKLMALPRMFTVRGLRTKSAFINIVVGITMTAFFFAYQVIFYIITHKMGGWSPADVPYTNLLNTAFPWIAVLMIGFMPAVSEEFMSRMFSIPFLQKAFRNRFTWLAVLIPAFIWGFGHATYPNQPFWVRGVEVGIAGVIIGFVMLRFGILAPLVWHYTVDALYTAFLLFRSDNPYFIITAAIASGLMVVPLLLALVAYWRKGGFLPDKGVLNEDIQLGVGEQTDTTEAVSDAVDQTAPLSAEQTPEIRTPFGARGRILAVVLLVAGVLIARPERPGDYVTSDDRSDLAIAVVADNMRASGLADPDTLNFQVFPTRPYRSNTYSGAYLLKELGSVKAFNDLMESQRKNRIAVSVWRPENRLRFIGVVDPDAAEVDRILILMPEEYPGDSLSIDSARTLARAALSDAGVDLSTLIEKSAEETARPHRRDYNFIYEAPEGDPRHVGEAKFRYSAWVRGSYVTASGSPYYDLPEAWERERKADTALRTIRLILIVGAFAFLIGYAITLLVLRTKKGEVPWKRAFLLAILPTILILPGLPSALRLLESEYFYRVELAQSVFMTSGWISLLLGTAVNYIIFALTFALLGTLYPEREALLRGDQRRREFVNSLLTAAGAIGAMMLVGRLSGWVGVWQPTWIPFQDISAPEWLRAPWMAGAMLRESVTSFATTAGALALISWLWAGPLRKPIGRLALILSVLLILQANSGVDPNEWLYTLIQGLLVVGFGWLGLRFFVNGNPVRFFAATWALAAFGSGTDAFGLGNGTAALQGWIFFGVATLGLLVWLMGAGGKRQQT